MKPFISKVSAKKWPEFRGCIIIWPNHVKPFAAPQTHHPRYFFLFTSNKTNFWKFMAYILNIIPLLLLLDRKWRKELIETMQTISKQVNRLEILTLDFKLTFFLRPQMIFLILLATFTSAKSSIGPREMIKFLFLLLKNIWNSVIALTQRYIFLRHH